MKYFFFCLLLLKSSDTDKFKNFSAYLAKTIEKYLPPPPEMDAGDSCFHHTALLKAKIDSQSHVVSIDLSDSGPPWLRNELQRIKANGRINFQVLDSIAKKDKIIDCEILFPFVIESENFPCGVSSQKRRLPEHYFHFNGIKPSGKIYFVEEIVILWPVRHFKKQVEKS